jgi:Family of unknown function (DUF6088)
MNVSHPVSDKIVAKIKPQNGAPVPISDLLGLGTDMAVKQSLSRLAKAGTIQRVGRGLYAWPRYSQLFHQTVPPPVHQLAEAWARKHSLKIIPFGAHAANLLGVSTQVPAKYIYYTNGHTQQVVLGGSKVKLLNRGPRTMDVRGDRAPLIFQAFKYLRAQGVTPNVIMSLQKIIRPRDRKDIRSSLSLAPQWMRPFLLRLINEESG